MSDIHSVIAAYHADARGLCGDRFNVASVVALADTEQRLAALALGAMLEAFDGPQSWLWVDEIAASHSPYRWLIEPPHVVNRRLDTMIATMTNLTMGAPPRRARFRWVAWREVCQQLTASFDGSFRAFLAAHHDDAVKAWHYLAEHQESFPVFSTVSIAAHWLDMVHRLGGIELANWSDLRVPVPPRLRSAARSFTLGATLLHPQAIAALSVWDRACQGYLSARCGLGDCPRRAT